MAIVYVKLFASILDSSIWSEDYPTRLVWITLLAMADAEGLVKASVSGVARRAAVKRVEAEKAVHILLSPDKDRPDQPHEGRRLEEVDGGWLVLNYEKYREIRTQQQLRDALRQKRHRDRTRVSRDASQHADAEADTEKKKRGGPRAAWVQEMCKVWEETYHGDAPWGIIAKKCQGLAAEKDGVELIAHWQNFLQATPARYATVTRFVETYGSWVVPGGQSNGKVPEDEAARRFREAGLSVSQYPVRPGGYENLADLQQAIEKRLQVERSKTA